jgi:hypothetical protein
LTTIIFRGLNAACSEVSAQSLITFPLISMIESVMILTTTFEMSEKILDDFGAP